MHLQGTLTATISVILVVGVWRHSSATAVPPLPGPTTLAPEACSLLTEAEVSAAIEVKSLPGKRAVESSPALCIWSDDASAGVNNRRVTLSITKTIGFDAAKSNLRSLTIEPVSGIGDDAYYEIFKTRETPILAVKKGSAAFVIRILNGLKLKPLAIDAVKAKEAELGKAAAGRL